MEQVTDRIWTETKVRGCNPSFVLTSKGPVMIDTPQLPDLDLLLNELPPAAASSNAELKTASVEASVS